MDGPQDVVTAVYRKVRAGALEEARALWSDSGRWHVIGSHPPAGDYSADEYLAFIQRFLHDHPDYRAEWLDVRSHDGTILIANLHSTGGPAPGTAQGVLVIRVTGGEVQEGWGIPAVPDRPF
ncbi:SnoaL-like domain-containing protein [Geodermatophilus dictyosporus]|uniref:SnoaL-like domain-containing protein n=1 Tax=Geodermatophilus dictyosporus TaxID=1523247 RepID=A0A1I5KP23_9ACTN|nr:nuclear transport factor 2 family protein [Geodermatophilus dictyosporus]SFO86291.1 SnoaL-like domain-containing protein [Geodermatophilus dictyosporus]